MFIDPQLDAWLKTLTPLDIADLTTAREASSRNQGGAEAVPAEWHGNLKVFRSEKGEGQSGPTIYNIHGGGFVLGSTTSDDPENTMLMDRLGATVVSPEYSLAPESPFPTAFHQCCEGLRWVADNIDSRPIIMGHSAGGGLAAVVAQWGVDNGIDVGGQILIEPELDPTLLSKSMRTYEHGPVWTRANAVLSWQYYLGDKGDQPYATVRENPGVIPRTYIIVNQSDPLRDEGIEYAQKLADSGTPVTLKMYPGTVHGSMSCLQAEITQLAYEELCTALSCWP